MAMTNYGSNSQTYEPCHTGPVKIMTIGKCDIWAGRHRDMNPIPHWTLRIRLLDGPAKKMERVIMGDDKARALLPDAVFELSTPPTIDIEWPDFSVPELDRNWWDALIGGIEAMPEGNIGVYCEGGHGRTGTFMSVLAFLGGACPSNKDPVMWLRNHYCDEVVESFRQVDYIQEITGAVVGVKPSFMTRGYGSAYGDGITTTTTTGKAKSNVTNVSADYDKTIGTNEDGTETIKWNYVGGGMGGKTHYEDECGNLLYTVEPHNDSQINENTSVFNAAGDLLSTNAPKEKYTSMSKHALDNSAKTLVQHLNNNSTPPKKAQHDHKPNLNKRGHKRGKNR